MHVYTRYIRICSIFKTSKKKTFSIIDQISTVSIIYGYFNYYSSKVWLLCVKFDNLDCLLI